MALTLQRKLELAGDLAKVQPFLQRLHVLDKPKKRHAVRNVILVSSVIGVIALAAVAVRRRRRLDDALVGDPQADSPNEDALPITG